MRTIILIMLAALAMAAASAAYPVEVTVASDHAWMVADNKDTTTITATVISGTGEHAGDPLEGANVTFTVKSPWQLKDSFLVTDKKGVATTTLFATKASGTANITVTASALILTETWGYLNYSASKTLSQPIDHGTPSSITPFHISQVQVGTSTHIAVLVTDQYGNPVDNRNVVENVQFAASAVGVSGFLSGTSWVNSITVPVNGSGYVDVQYHVGAKGQNYIGYTPPAPISSGIICISGVYSGEPASITQSISPDGAPPRQLADGISKFTITYLLSDSLGGGSANRVIQVTTLTGEHLNITTNENGLAQITYGPAMTPGVATVNAMVPGNPFINSSLTIEFVALENDMVLTADPQSMASLDIKGTSVSNVKGQVITNMGKPVPGQTVNFRLTSVTNGTTVLTKLPALSSGASSTGTLNMDLPVVTDANGYAAVNFYPGEFTTDKSSLGYNVAETGRAVVQATYGSKTREVNLSFRNYNYVSVVTDVTPQSVPQGGIVNITITLAGDGDTLQPDPVNVVLVMDQSWSMGNPASPWPIDGQPRIYWAKIAAKAFVGSLNKATDKIAYLPFGTDPSIAVQLTNDFDAINKSIDNTKPQANMAYSTNLRKALYLAIKHLKEAGSPDPKTVKAVIVMTDGGWNSDGTPLAKGTGYPDTRDYYNEKSKKWTNYSGNQQGYTGVDNLNFPDLQYQFHYVSYKYFTAIGGGTVTTYDTSHKQLLPTKTGQWDCNNQNTGCVPSSSGDKNSTMLCTDGEFTVQNMSVFAKNSNIRLYTIAYANPIPSADLTPTHIQALRVLADATRGTYNEKTTGTGLTQLYVDIAGALRDKAGVGITMTVDHHNVAVNGTPMENTINRQLFSYIHSEGNSTTIKSWNSSATAGNPYNIIPFHTEDQTGDWLNDQNLTFTVGTVTVGQTWVARYQLQMNTLGSIDIFGKGSTLSFTDAFGTKSAMDIPDKFVTVLGTPTTAGLGGSSVKVQDLDCRATRITDQLPLQWNLTYIGTGTVSQTFWYAKADTPDVQTQYATYLTALPAGTYTLTKSNPLSLPAGNYIFTVKASGSDGGYDEKSIPIEIHAIKVTIKIL